MVVTSKGWTLDSLLATAPNFALAHSLDRRATALASRVSELLERGLPVVVTGYDEHETMAGREFSLDHVRAPHVLGNCRITVRDVVTNALREIKFSRFLDYCDEYDPFVLGGERERLCAKDIEPPPAWAAWLAPGNALPPDFLPLSGGDMFAHLPKNARPETAMCYFGTGDTYTAWDRDPCGSVGQNIIVHAAPGASTFWFMIGTRDADRASSYFQSKQQSLDSEHGAPFTLPPQLADAPFTVYVCQQRRGDIVLFPPRCAHQAINHRGLVGSLSWSRMTLPSLGHALYHELPVYNRIKRMETYRVKATVYYAVRHFATQHPSTHGTTMLKELLRLLDMILVSEYSAIALALEPSGNPSYDSADAYWLSCDVCYADIFVSYFECKRCQWDVCPLCYVSGRGCECVAGMMPAVVVRFGDILDTRNACAQALSRAQDGGAAPQLTGVLIETSSPLQTFRAACALHTLRQSARTTVECGHGGHDASASDCLHCGLCGTHICFLHLLAGPAGLHAARAIVEHGRLSNAKWHALHSTAAPKPRIDDQNADWSGVYLRLVTGVGTPNPSAQLGGHLEGWYPSRGTAREHYARARQQVSEMLQADVDSMMSRIHAASPQNTTYAGLDEAAAADGTKAAATGKTFDRGALTSDIAKRTRDEHHDDERPAKMPKSAIATSRIVADLVPEHPGSSFDVSSASSVAAIHAIDMSHGPGKLTPKVNTLLHLKSTFAPLDISANIRNISMLPQRFGGNTEIFLGDWARGEQTTKIAIKRIRDAGAASERIIRSLRREISLWRNLQHENVQPLYGILWDARELPAMVSPWHQNGDINNYVELHRSEPGIGAIKARLLTEALRGLKYLHDNNIVHADVKGANVLVTDAGIACVCDFGISVMLEEQSTSTQRSFLKGTCRWMAPELFDDDDARHDMFSDVWAFGCLILEVYSGSRPYGTKKNDAAVIKALGRRELPHRPDGIPEPVWQLVLECCMMEPRNRLQVGQIIQRMGYLAQECVVGERTGENQVLRDAGSSELEIFMTCVSTPSGVPAGSLTSLLVRRA